MQKCRETQNVYGTLICAQRKKLTLPSLSAPIIFEKVVADYFGHFLLIQQTGGGGLGISADPFNRGTGFFLFRPQIQSEEKLNLFFHSLLDLLWIDLLEILLL